MTFANVGLLGAKPGKRDQLIAILTRPNRELIDVGCLSYAVGASEDDPDTVFVSELWVSAEAHRASLQLESVRAAISEAMPLLSGTMSGHQFNVSGSPLRGSHAGAPNPDSPHSGTHDEGAANAP